MIEIFIGINIIGILKKNTRVKPINCSLFLTFVIDNAPWKSVRYIFTVIIIKLASNTPKSKRSRYSPCAFL